MTLDNSNPDDTISVGLEIVSSLLEQEASWIPYFLTVGRSISDAVFAIPSSLRTETTPTAVAILTYFIPVLEEDDARSALFDRFRAFRCAPVRSFHSVNGVFCLCNLQKPVGNGRSLTAFATIFCR